MKKEKKLTELGELIKNHEKKFYEKHFTNLKNIDDTIYKYFKKIFLKLGTSYFILNNLVTSLEKTSSKKNLKKDEKKQITLYLQTFTSLRNLLECCFIEIEKFTKEFSK